MSVVSQLFNSSSVLPRYFQARAVDEFDLTFRRQENYETRNAINDLTKTLFTVLHVV